MYLKKSHAIAEWPYILTSPLSNLSLATLQPVMHAHAKACLLGTRKSSPSATVTTALYMHCVAAEDTLGNTLKDRFHG